jgi:hypothetical protein
MIRSVNVSIGQNIMDIALQHLGTVEAVYEVVRHGANITGTVGIPTTRKINFGGIKNTRNMNRIKEKGYIFVNGV